MRREDLKPITVVTDDGQTSQCAESAYVVIGGSAARISVPHDVSRNEYAHIENRQGHAWLVPLTPTITIRINGTVVTQATPLRDEDQLVIGDALFLIGVDRETVKVCAADSVPQAEAEQAAASPSNKVSRHGRLRVFKLALFGAFLLLVAVVLFVFSATPVSVAINPTPDSLEFQGFPPPVRVKDRYLVLPGSYQLRATKPGYESLAVSVSVAGSDFKELNYTLQKLPGRISIKSQPNGAMVTLGGQSIGSTPLVHRKVPAGLYKVVLSAPRYRAIELTLEVEGMDREQMIQIELAPDWAPVTFRSEPVGASILIDGKELGRTPLTADLLSGSHAVSFELDRHQPETIDITVVAGEALALPVLGLTPAPGELTVSSNPVGATVTVDGTYQGSTPVELTLTPELEHNLTLAKPGYVVMERRIKMEAAEKKAISIDLAQEYGVVFITSDPIDATLYVDGKRRGRASQRLRLTTRPHALEFQKPGYQTHRITLTPRAGVSKELSVRLVADSVAVAPSAVANRVRTSEGQELRLITPGQFTMGASRREQGRRANENLRRIELTRPYYVGTKEVTNAEFRRFKPEHSSGSAYGRSLDLDEQPAVNVSWEDAIAYLNWLSEKDGLPSVYVKSGESWQPVSPMAPGYRLPTEAEWSYATRFSGSEPRKYAWDGAYPPTQPAENFGDQSASGLLPYSLPSYNDAFAVTAPVGSFAPNESGFYDLGGNVAEWTHDYYAVYPAQTDTVIKDPVGPSSGRHHVIRGAGWKDSTISELRLSFRDYADSPRNDLGFRIARHAD